MQTPSGSRGAQSYSFDNLDTDIKIVKESNATAGNFLPERQNDIFISYASFNLRDQVRKDESTPLQFVYEAANCRIFYTKDTVYNFGKLWRYAANAIWAKPELCVQGSTGIASNGSSSDLSGPADSSSENSHMIPNITAILELSGEISAAYPDLSTQQFDKSSKKTSQVGDDCDEKLVCFNRLVCAKNQCAHPCNTVRNDCHCIPFKQPLAGSKKKIQGNDGYCSPSHPCDRINYNPDKALPNQC